MPSEHCGNLVRRARSGIDLMFALARSSDLRNAGEQGLEVRRLLKNAVESCPDKPSPLRFGKRGKCEDGCSVPYRIGSQPSAQFITVHVRHADVGEDQARTVSHRHRQAFDAPAGGFNLITFRLQDGSQCTAAIFVVLYHENTESCGGVGLDVPGFSHLLVATSFYNLSPSNCRSASGWDSGWE